MSRRRKKSGSASSGSVNGSATLERKVRDLRLTVEQKALERQLGITESGVALVNRAEWLPVGWGFGGGANGAGLGVGGLTERRDGNNAPFVMTEGDLREQRAFARLVTTAESVGVGIVKTLTDYVIGDGYIYEAIARRGKQTPDGLLEEIQDVIDEFDEDNKFTGGLDKELYNRDLADGETFLGLHPTPAGRVKARVIEPDFVTDTGNLPLDDDSLFNKYGITREHADNCTFGLHSPDHDDVDILGFCIQWPDGNQDYYPKLYVEHNKRNSFQNVKRGMTDFYPVWEWILQQSRVLKNTGEAAAEQAAIAYIVQHVQGTTKDQVESMVRTGGDYDQTVYGQNGSRTVSKRRHPPGTHKHIPEGMEYMPGPTGHERGSAFLDVVQGILRQIAVRWALSEGQISGDDSNNNMASSVVAGSRFHVGCRSEQGERKRYYRQIFWKVLLFAYHAGRFERFGFAPGAKSWREFKRLIDIQIEAPPINERNKLEEEQIRGIQHAAKLLSRKTWQAKSELEGDVEDKHIQEEMQKDADAVKKYGDAATNYGQEGAQPSGQPGIPAWDGADAEATHRRAPSSTAGMSDIPSISKELGAPESTAVSLSRQQIELLVTEMVQSQMFREPAQSELSPNQTVQFHGMTIVIENPKGSMRRGVGADGKPWANTMAAHYGEVIGLAGADGDYPDVFIGPHPASELVFVIDQIDQQTGKFDEHKCLLGFNSRMEAVDAYLRSYDSGWKVGPVRAMHIDDFRDWVMTGRQAGPQSGAVNPQEGAGSPQVSAGQATSPPASGPVSECEDCGNENGDLTDEAKAFLEILKRRPANRIVETYP